jgi:hypothetical protein
LIDRAIVRQGVHKNEFESSRDEFGRMMSRLRGAIERERAEMERTNQRLQLAMLKLRAEMDAALEEFERAVGGPASLELASWYRDRFGDWPNPKQRSRSRRRGLDDGGELSPVEPRPNPPPLIDGAEAPLD